VAAVNPMTLSDFRSVLRGLPAAGLAALLIECGFELYRRDISAWRVLTQLADELMDRETFLARRHLDEAWLRTARKNVTRRARRRR